MANIDFDLNLIKYYIAVYEENSISKASTKLFISQPAITQNIKKLEEIMGCELFIRFPRGVKPTLQGEILYDNFKKAINSIGQGVNLLSEFNDNSCGHISIGSSSTIMRGLLLPFVFHFRKKFPNIQISIIDGISTQLMDSLKRGDIDIAIMADPVLESNDMDKKIITQIEDCFIVNKKFKHEFLKKENINDYDVILQKLPSSNRVFFDKLCKKNNVSIKASLETESFGIIIDFISNTDDMIGYSTKNFIKNELKNKNIKILATDFDILPRNVCAYSMKDRSISKSTKLFIDELENFFKKV